MYIRGLASDPCTRDLHGHFSVNTVKIFKHGFTFHVSGRAQDSRKYATELI